MARRLYNKGDKLSLSADKLSLSADKLGLSADKLGFSPINLVYRIWHAVCIIKAINLVYQLIT